VKANSYCGNWHTARFDKRRKTLPDDSPIPRPRVNKITEEIAGAVM
jgi:hypothetical protein